jgi:hypothetical protein
MQSADPSQLCPCSPQPHLNVECVISLHCDSILNSSDNYKVSELHTEMREWNTCRKSVNAIGYTVSFFVSSKISTTHRTLTFHIIKVHKFHYIFFLICISNIFILLLSFASLIQHGSCFLKSRIAQVLCIKFVTKSRYILVYQTSLI